MDLSYLHLRPHAQFAMANWTFLDAAILSAHAQPPHETEPVLVHVTFVDWIPGICSLLGMVIVNLIDKDRVRGEEGFGDSRAVWRARLFLFISFALMAGGLAGSIVSVSHFVSLKSPFPPRVQYMCLTRGPPSQISFPSTERLDPQVHLEQLSRNVQVLRLLQRFAERWVDALGGRTLDIPEQQWRVRVQPHYLTIPLAFNYSGTRSWGLVVDSFIPFAFLCSQRPLYVVVLRAKCLHSSPDSFRSIESAPCLRTLHAYKVCTFIASCPRPGLLRLLRMWTVIRGDRKWN